VEKVAFVVPEAICTELVEEFIPISIPQKIPAVLGKSAPA
jgi:hypothetical protein